MLFSKLSNHLKNFTRKLFFERKFIVKDKNKKIFSVRKFGGATSGRAESFFSKEPSTVKWIDGFEKNSNFLDIGANIGIYSLYAASKDINVFSLEPESSNYYQLNLNIMDNDFQEKIKAFPLSASNNFKFGILHLDTLKIGGSGHTFLSEENEKKLDNKNLYPQGSISFSVDKLIEMTSFVPNYVKIDVDGNEDLIVEGMKNILKHKNLKSILIEINKENTNHIKSLEQLKNNDFKLFNTENYTENLSNYIFIKKN